MSKRAGFGMVEVIVASVMMAGLGLVLAQTLGVADRGWQRVSKKATQNDFKLLLSYSGTGDLLKFLNFNRQNPMIDDCVPQKKATEAAGSRCQSTQKIGELDAQHRTLIEPFLSDTQYIVDAELYGLDGAPLAGSLKQPMFLRSDGSPCMVARTVDYLDLATGAISQQIFFGTTKGNDRSIASVDSLCPLRVTGYLARQDLSHGSPPNDPGNLRFVIVVDDNPNAKIPPGMNVKPTVNVLRVPASIRRQPSCAPGTALVGFTAEGELNCQPLAQSNVSCPAGQFMNGVQANGQPTCVTLGASALTCGPNEFLQGIKANGQADCKPVSTIINEVTSTIVKTTTQFARVNVSRPGAAPAGWQQNFSSVAYLPRSFKTVDSTACWIGAIGYTNSWMHVECSVSWVSGNRVGVSVYWTSGFHNHGQGWPVIVAVSGTY
jgi:hypothetical protein